VKVFFDTLRYLIAIKKRDIAMSLSLIISSLSFSMNLAEKIIQIRFT